LITTKKELIWDINEIISKIVDRHWEIHELRKKGQLATASLGFLKGKVEKAETVEQLQSLPILANRKHEELKPALEDDIKLEKERLKREEKKWHEQTAKRRQDRERLLRHYTDILPLYIPCPKYTEAVLGTFLVKYDIEWAMVLGS